MQSEQICLDFKQFREATARWNQTRFRNAFINSIIFQEDEIIRDSKNGWQV